MTAMLPLRRSAPHGPEVGWLLMDIQRPNSTELAAEPNGEFGAYSAIAKVLG